MCIRDRGMPSYHTSGFEVLNTLAKNTDKNSDEKTKERSSDIDRCFSEDKNCQTRYLEAFSDCA